MSNEYGNVHGVVERSLPGALLTIYVGAEPYDMHDSNVDVEVALADGRRFSATAFTLRNVSRVMENFASAGECAGGLYFWCRDLVILPDVSIPTIERVVRSLLESGTLHEVFLALD